MKKNTLKWIFNFGMLSLCLGFLTSCENEENLSTSQNLATCTDGMMNGNETGIDCGGQCEPCEDGMELGRRAELYVTNNANGDITKYSVTGDSLVTLKTASEAAEGIYYDNDKDLVVQASRSALWLEGYKGVSMLTEDTEVAADFTSVADFESPRELAVMGDMYVVADNGSHKFFVYRLNGDSFALEATVEVPFPVWGIAFKGTDLYAVVDQSSDLTVFYDFVANASNGPMNPSKRVTIEGIVRTHGLTYSAADDVMVMTDIGDAANTTDDGGFHLIPNFSATFDALSDGDVLPMSIQVRVGGASTMMGNPIDVAYDSETDAVYISEIGNGKVLGFTSIGDGGDLAPSFNMDLEAASSIYFSSDETDGDLGDSTTGMKTELYVTSVANGEISVYDANSMLLKRVMSASDASEGIFYSGMQDAVFQASRSELVLQRYSDFSMAADGSKLTPAYSGDTDLESPREIAVYGNKIVVADNAENKLFVYSYWDDAFNLDNVFKVDFPLWGITFMGKSLLAVVDTTGDLAIFNNFLTANTADGMIQEDKRITIEGIVRTHGIDYSESGDVLVMTDIGDAADALTDGAFHVIADFGKIIGDIKDGGSLSMMHQKRVAGPSTALGNPIDIAYDHDSDMVYIAEIGYGKMLAFANALSTEGNIAPTGGDNLEGASSIYLFNN